MRCRSAVKGRIDSATLSQIREVERRLSCNTIVKRCPCLRVEAARLTESRDAALRLDAESVRQSLERLPLTEEHLLGHADRRVPSEEEVADGERLRVDSFRRAYPPPPAAAASTARWQW